MRILHTEASQGWGGQEIRIINESKIFSEKGHSVAIAANHNSPLIQNARKAGLTVIEVNLSKKNIKSLISLHTAIKYFSPDVISCHSSTDHWLSAVARFFLKNAPKIVRTRHISAKVTRNFPTKWLYNYGSDHIMTTGNEIRNALLGDNFVKEKNISSVPTGINENLFIHGDKKIARSVTKLPESKIIIGIIATLRSWKGHSYLIDAVSEIPNNSIQLVIVGDGPQKENLQNQVKLLGCEKKIKFVGQQDNVLPYLQSFDCFALPSYANEGIPQALLQAMAIGLHIITCAIGGIPEAIESYPRNTIVSTKSSDALKDAILSFIASFNETANKPTPQILYTEESMYINAKNVYETVISKRW